MSETTRKVTVCGVPHELSIVDGGAMFSDKSGFWGVSKRVMFEYRELWYIVDGQATFDNFPLCHLVKMHKLLMEHIGGDHEVKEFKFKEPVQP